MFSFRKTVPDYVEHADQIVVIPDIHGDLPKAKACLRGARVIDDKGDWIGGRTVVVQLGDQVDSLDRSGMRSHVCDAGLRRDVDVINFFNMLHRQAESSGGAVYSLIGNHELMNVKGIFSYADTCPSCEDKRREWFRPGGRVARVLATTRAVVLKIGKVVFVHAGLLPWHINTIGGDFSAVNAIMTDAFLGNERPVSDFVLFERLCFQSDGMLTNRMYTPTAHLSVNDTDRVLRSIGAEHMVIGHNAHHKGISVLHNNKVFIVDPGVSESVLHGRPQALVITARPPCQGGSCSFEVAYG